MKIKRRKNLKFDTGVRYIPIFTAIPRFMIKIVSVCTSVWAICCAIILHFNANNKLCKVERKPIRTYFTKLKNNVDNGEVPKHSKKTLSPKWKKHFKMIRIVPPAKKKKKFNPKIKPFSYFSTLLSFINSAFQAK